MWTQDTVLSVGLLATLFVVIGQNFTSTLGICQSFRFVTDDNVVTDHALEGHVFKISTVERATQCHVMCKNDCSFVSMNYIWDNEQDNCELNDVNKEMKPAALEYKSGASYYGLVRDK